MLKCLKERKPLQGKFKINERDNAKKENLPILINNPIHYEKTKYFMD